ncbi:UDP:flavonoid glycosyltransferase YjiC, YdhE family [Pseudonocardia ammonioxydans]|uniref:UDP:flavonoid glycosyltransferase YjiC, YdhE family n=1 Tax=Pseudonocardia ammonioxydans TaxID=260086 RepID=A0A1I5FI31_PSUAM|nr:glycosyltransferase [Pseudonocardia ammonioxydans]SFO23293.1 UDP:flavonoid glycosyltransferase YjiC, YdhE family [Pseudonocardia ammonioxydans]
MRVVVVAIGSTGDVLPYTGLAARLRADGHEVAIATHAPFDAAVRASGARFHPLPMDMERELASPRGQRSLRYSATGSAGTVALYRRHWREMGAAITRAAAGADVLLVSMLGWQGIHVAEAMGIPSMGVYLQPFDPTAEFPPWALTRRSLGRWGNRAAARALRVLGQVPFRSATAELRRDLGLAPLGIREHFARLDRDRWPVFYGFGSAVLGAPRDWPAWRRVVGYWWPEAEPGRELPPELTAFLATGDPPVVVTLGSMAPGDAGSRLAAIRAALRATGRRAVVQAGWAGLDPIGDERLLTIGPARHDLLFPQAAAVVHHAGAGTTAAGLRAGVPAVPLPLAADQPLWARRLVELGVAPAEIPLRRVTAAALAGAVGDAVQRPGPRQQAGRLAERLAGEDGAGAVAEALRTGRYW